MKLFLVRLVIAINSFLHPVENKIEKYRKYIGFFILFLAFFISWISFFPNKIKESGEYAITLLWIILWIPIFARVFGMKIIQLIMPLRREIGILMGTLAFVHGARYYLNSPTAIGKTSFWIQNDFLSYLAFGFFALILTIPLTLTSSKWAMKKMGKYWKWLHRSVYLIILFAVAHVVLLKSFLHLEY